jgi:hypothetical protein
MPLSREEQVQLADSLVEPAPRRIRQFDIAREHEISQALVSQLKRIKNKCCPQAFQVWSTGIITTESAWDLSKLNHEQQVERLNTLTGDNRNEWSLELSRECGRNKRPHLKELRTLIADLQNAEDLDADKVEVAVAALRHSAGDLSREALLDLLK